MPLTGLHVRDYEVWGRLSEGGMSEVWLAKHSVLNVPVVLKTLRPTIDADVHGFDRMLTEARLMARIPSARVVRALDAGVFDGLGYVVQEYVDGIDLAELDRERRAAIGVGLPLWFVCTVMHELCLALHASHQTGVIHRDVKPSNVFGSPQTGIRLGDFGIAIAHQEASVPSEISGTFKFMAPEQLRGDPLGRATDVYGAGATAFDLRYGCSAFPDVSSTLDPDQGPRFPSAPTPSEAYFQHVLHGMMTKDPKRRARDLPALSRHFGALAKNLRPTIERVGCASLGRNKLLLGECEVTFEVGDIASCTADAIVNSAHDHMRMQTGVGAALRARGGDEIERAAMAGGVRALGTCVLTTAGKLDARWVIHAVSAWNEVSCVGRTAHRVLNLAETLAVRTLAIPALGTGASRVTYEACANALATALRQHVSLGGSRLRSVRFVLRDEQVRDVFRGVAEEALRDGDEGVPAIDLGLQADGEVRVDAATHIAAKTETA